MGKFWKIFRLALAGAAIFLLLAAVFTVVVLPRLINSPAVKDKIRAVARQQIDAEIDFKQLDLHFLPRPHVAVTNAALSIPPGIKATYGVAKIYPEILPLFSGKVRIAAALLESASAEFNLDIREVPAGKKTRTSWLSIVEMKTRLQAAIQALPEMKIPWMKLRIVNGRVALRAGGREVLELTKINGDLRGPPENRLMTYSCASNFWQEITIRASLDSRTFIGSARINLSQLRSNEVISYLFPESAFKFDGVPASFEIHLKTDGPDRVRAQVQGSVPSLNLQGNGQTFNIQCRSLKGTLEIDKDSLLLSLPELSLEHPRMDLSAELAAVFPGPKLKLRAEGREIDVGALRQLALGALGRNQSVQGIFDVVRGGKVPLITVTAEGKSAAELGDLDHMVIQGKMEQGEIHVSSGQLDLKEASGEAVISKGILVGKNLAARLGNSRGHKGQLRLGLKSGVDPFHLDIGVQADLSDLPPVLGRLIDDRHFRQQLAKLEALTGSASGRLVLGEDTADVNVRAEVDSIRLEARYRPIPFPVKVSAGSCRYLDSGFKIAELAGTLGTSSFRGLSGAVDWQKEPTLQIDSGKLDIVFKDLLPWLSSYKQLAALRQYYAGGKGAVALASIRLKGPLFSPRQWRFATSGNIADLALNFPSPSAPTTFVSTAFTADNQVFSYTAAQVHWLDAVVKISGRHPGYLENFEQNGHLSMAGRLDARSIKWLSQHTLLPAQVKLHPLTLSAAQLNWDKSGKTALTASLAIDQGGRVSLDLVYSPDELNIKKVLIEDQQSHAAIGFVLRKKTVDLSFEGNLSKDSVDWIMAENDILSGWIKGNFKAHIDVDHTLDSTVQGQLEGKNLISVWGLRSPVKINRFSLSATGQRIDLQSAEFNWQGSTMQLDGNVSYASRKMAADLRLVADEINGDEVRKALDRGGREPETSRREASWPPPIHGRLNVKAKRFLYAGYTWRPLHADMTLSEKGLDVDVTEASLCGISTPGSIHVSPQKVIQLDFKPAAVKQQLEHTLPCLFGDMMKLEGRYTMNGQITADASIDELKKSLGGHVTFGAQDGRFYYDTLVLNILEYLDAVKIFTGRLKEIRQEGQAFRSTSMRARLEKETVIFEEMALDSGAIKMAGQGKINLIDQSVDFDILVAVVKTVNRVLDKIPLLGAIANNMLSIPVAVKGDLKSPSVMPLAPSAVGAELTGIMKKVLSIGGHKKPPAGSAATP